MVSQGPKRLPFIGPCDTKITIFGLWDGKEYSSGVPGTAKTIVFDVMGTKGVPGTAKTIVFGVMGTQKNFSKFYSSQVPGTPKIIVVGATGTTKTIRSGLGPSDTKHCSLWCMGRLKTIVQGSHGEQKLQFMGSPDTKDWC